MKSPVVDLEEECQESERESQQDNQGEQDDSGSTSPCTSVSADMQSTSTPL